MASGAPSPGTADPAAPADIPSLSVSVIVPFQQDSPYLRELLSAFERLDPPPREIILLPDDRLAGLKTSAAFTMVIKPTGPITPPEKRDLGASVARGDLLAFIDDDAYPAPDWLKTALPYFRDPSVGAVGGPAITPPDEPPRQKASGHIFASWLMAGRHACRYRPTFSQELDDFPSCNLIVRKCDFIAAGGFASRFWPGEDTIFCLKLTRELGKALVYAPEVRVWHHRRPIFFPHLRQLGRYAFNRGYSVKEFPATSFRLCYFLPSLLLAWIFLGWIPACSWRPWMITYASSLAGYFGLLASAAMRVPEWDLKLPVGLGIFLSHLVYGGSFLCGLFSPRETNRPPPGCKQDCIE